MGSARHDGHSRTQNTDRGGQMVSRRSSLETAVAGLIGVDDSGDNPVSPWYCRAQEVDAVSVVAVVRAEVG